MDQAMRRILTFPCAGATLAATLDEASGKTGVLIVSGGNEIRTGSHRGMARLAGDLAGAGFPAFRFDRRGIGDSEGDNAGFEGSAADLEAAVVAFLQHCPHVERVIGFGNCDGAAALALHGAAVDGLVIANPWVIEPKDDMPSSATIRAHYLKRVRDPKAWASLFAGKINLRKLASGLSRAAHSEAPSNLATRVANGLARHDIPITILLAKGDGTAIAFADHWETPDFEHLRAQTNIDLRRFDSSSHSFVTDIDYAFLKAAILDQCAAKSA